MLREKTNHRRDLVRVRLAGAEGNGRAEVRTALAALAEPELAIAETDLRSQAGSDDATDVVMVVFDGDREGALNCLQENSQTQPHPALFALLPDKSPEMVRRALRAGADEVLFMPLEQTDAARALLKISEARRKSERVGAGVVCSLVSVSGGVGVTTIAANLALALHYGLDKQVALVDLDLQSSALSVALNLEPERTLMDLIGTSVKLDSILLESALSKHPSGIYLLAAPKKIEDGERVTAGDVGAALDLMRQMFDFVVVDVGRHIGENAVAVWERSEHLFYVLDQSISAVRCAWRFLHLFGRLGLAAAEPGFILSRYVHRHMIGEEQIAHTLARQMYARIPLDERSLELASSRAQDLWKAAPRAPLTRSFEELGRKLSGPQTEAAAARSSGILAKLLSIAGAQS